MFSGNQKRIVVIKDIPSNLIEEAIFILKHEPGGNKSNKALADAFYKNRKKENDYLLKEAEMIINNYIRENKGEVKASSIPAANTRVNAPKSKLMINTFINLALVGSIALLIFLITRII